MESLYVKAAPSPRSRHRKRRMRNKTGSNLNGGESKTGEKVKLIDGKRARNVAISLARLNQTFEQIRKTCRNVATQID